MKNFRERFEIKPDRWVYVPTPACSEVGERVKALIDAKWVAPHYFFHIVGGGGHVKALSVHRDSRYFAKLDLSNFFGSIGLARVTRILKKFASYEQAREWAKWSVVKPINQEMRHLPFGFVQSSILASVALDSSVLGCRLSELAPGKSRRHRSLVSVYVDDIIISSNRKAELRNDLEGLVEAAEKSLFEVNLAKTVFPSETIQAFNLDIVHGELRVGSEKFAEFEVALKSKPAPAVVSGILSYVGSVNPAQAADLRDQVGPASCKL